MNTTEAGIGIDVGGTGTKGAVVARDGTILVRVQRPTIRQAGTKGIIAVAEDLLARAAEMEVRVTSIGVGAAGFVEARTGSVTFSPNLTYDDPHVAGALHARTELPVFVDNDANAAAWGERQFGTAMGTDDLAYVTIGTGIGSGFVVEGRLVRGSTGAGAELGHMVVDPDGPECNCGLRGCLEQLASGQAIARSARLAAAESPATSILELAGAPEAVTAEHVARAADQHDEVARSVLARAGRMLGLGLSNVVNIFDPHVIVLGGSVIKAGEPFLGPARDELVRCTTRQRRRPARLDVTSLGNDAGIMGAAALGWNPTAGERTAQ
jgi:glucokinase